MIVLMDVGNTRLKYCSIEFDSTGSERYSTIKWLDNKMLTLAWLNEQLSAATQIVMANVHHQKIAEDVKKWSEQAKVTFKLVTTEPESFGIKNGYENPFQLGVDRWLAVLGIAKLYPNKHCLIIDAGTATTIDLLDNQGKHLGGWIAPGVNTMFTSVISNTSQVKAEQKNFQQLSFGLNSSVNLTHGCWAATLGLIEQAIKQSEKQLTTLDVIALTGGNAETLGSLLNLKNNVIEHLVFHGLSRFLIK